MAGGGLQAAQHHQPASSKHRRLQLHPSCVSAAARQFVQFVARVVPLPRTATTVHRPKPVATTEPFPALPPLLLTLQVRDAVSQTCPEGQLHEALQLDLQVGAGVCKIDCGQYVGGIQRRNTFLDAQACCMPLIYALHVLWYVLGMPAWCTGHWRVPASCSAMPGSDAGPRC